MLIRDSTAIILNLNGQNVLFPSDSEPDHPIVRDSFLCVFQKIQEHFFQLDLVACEFTQIFRDGRDEFDIRFFFIQRNGQMRQQYFSEDVQ